jgi:hypothetical protein
MENFDLKRGQIFCFSKCVAFCGGQILLDSTASRYTHGGSSCKGSSLMEGQRCQSHSGILACIRDRSNSSIITELTDDQGECITDRNNLRMYAYPTSVDRLMTVHLVHY